MNFNHKRPSTMSNLADVPLTTGLRRMFYVVTPNETCAEKVEDVPQFINEATPFFFVFIFLEIGISAYKGDKKIRLNDGFTSIMAGIFSRLPMFLLGSITIGGYMWVYDNYRLMELPWDSAWTWWLCFLGVDLAYYWFHRLAHEVNFMWAAHQVHHSSEDYNFTTALRQSVLQTYTSWVFYLPMALCIPPSVFFVHVELNILYQFWIHTQYIKSLGPLEYIINTPSHHRVHHGRNPYCIDKNYAGTLIIWDRLFGTFAAEEEEIAYGLVHNIGTFEPFTIQFGYLKYVLGRFVDIDGLKNKIMVMLCGPGWSPGKPRTGDINDIPQVERPVKKYDSKLPRWLTIYVLIHFVVFMLGYQEFIARKMGFSMLTVLIFVVYVGFSLTCFGHLFDKKVSFVYLELVRCLLLLLGDIIMCQAGFYGQAGVRPWPVYTVQVFFSVSAAIWLIQAYRLYNGEKMKLD